MVAHPGAMDHYLGATEARPETWIVALEPWKLILEPWGLTSLAPEPWRLTKEQ
jgi:hypothetical protein